MKMIRNLGFHFGEIEKGIDYIHRLHCFGELAHELPLNYP
jgi:hypothetical protein